MYDVVVVGAGLAGCVMAERMATRAGKRVLVVEKRHHIGGNCYDEMRDGIRVHRYGPHLFHTDDAEVWRYLSAFTAWEPYEHRVLAHIDGHDVELPFNLTSLYRLFPEGTARRIEAALVERYGVDADVPVLELKKSDEPLLRQLAETVYEKVFKHYTAKQWGLLPEEIDASVTARVPVRTGKENRYFRDRYQAVPKEGYATMFERMLAHPRIGVLSGTDAGDILALDETGGIHLFGQPFEGMVIYTGMVDALFGYRFGALPYRSVEMVFETKPVAVFQPAATVNYPNAHDFTRITEFKHIHPADVRHTVILKEYPGPFEPGKNEPYYPFFTEEAQALHRTYADYAQRYDSLVLLGRLAEYRYYDMDDMVRRALDTFGELDNG